MYTKIQSNFQKMAQFFIFSIIFYASLLLVRAEKLSSLPEFPGLIEIEKDAISASFISNIEIQLKSSYSPEKILGYLNTLEKSIRKQYEENAKISKDLKIEYDLSVSRIDENLESHSNRINELEENIEYIDQSKLLLLAINDHNNIFKKEIKEIIKSDSLNNSEVHRNDAKIKIIKKIDAIIESIKLNSTDKWQSDFKEMKDDFGIVGAMKEYFYMSNLKNYEKTKLLGYLYDLKEKFLRKLSLIEKQALIKEKNDINFKSVGLLDQTDEIIKITNKLMLSHNQQNEILKDEMKSKKEFQNQIIDEKNKLKNLWVVESTNNNSLEKNILDSLNGIRKVRQYFIRNYSKLKRYIQKNND